VRRIIEGRQQHPQAKVVKLERPTFVVHTASIEF
jgi:hypothetical protein